MGDDDRLHATLAQLEAVVEDQRHAQAVLEESRAGYAELYDSAPVAYLTIDGRGFIRDANLPAVAFLGAVERDWLVGRRFSDVISSHSEDAFAEHLARCLRDGQAVSELVGRLRGAQIMLQLESAVLPRWVGEALFATVIRDVSRRTHSEEVLRFFAETARRLGRSLDRDVLAATAAHLAVPRLADACIFDLHDGKRWYRAGLAHRDARAAAALATSDTPGHKLVPALEEAMSRAMATGQPQLVANLGGHEPAASEGGRLLATARLGSALVIAPTPTAGVLSLFTAAGLREFTPAEVLLAQEFSHTTAMALENARLHLALRTANRAKDTFLQVVSHELRAPLAAMFRWIDVARRAVDGPGRAAALDAIEASARMQSRLVEDLVDVVRGMSGRLSVALEAADAGSIVGHAVDLLRPEAQACGVGLELVAPGPGLLVWADPQRLAQIVTNVVHNALKFSPPRSQVKVTLARAGDEIRVVVRDHGRGIAPDRLATLFTPFQATEDDEGGVHAGLGVGLAIARELVHLHGGEITAASEGVGRGAEFTVVLPALSSPRGARTGSAAVVAGDPAAGDPAVTP
jgi:PAS domain S-box-containing protein